MPYVTSIERLARQEGMAEGEAKGKAEGEAKGKAEGEAKGKADMLLRALQRRFPESVPENIVAQIRGTRDGTLLDRWFDLVFDSDTLETFQQKMLP